MIYNKQLTIHPQIVGELQDSAISVDINQAYGRLYAIRKRKTDSPLEQNIGDFSNELRIFPTFRTFLKLIRLSIKKQELRPLRSKEWRKRSIPTHLERHNPPTIIAKMGLKRA